MIYPFLIVASLFGSLAVWARLQHRRQTQAGKSGKLG